MNQSLAARDAFGQTGPADEPFIDNLAYGEGPDDFTSDTSVGTAVTHHTATLGGVGLPYTAYAGHLIAVDPVKSIPAAKFFYVSYIADDKPAATRPVTFFYNGGPGASSVFLLLGSFGPRRIHTSMPDITPPAPYLMEDNPDSLLDRSDLVFINPVGTGYSTAIAPFKNRDFWGVDQDARSIKQFIKSFLLQYKRWNSPKFLFGESYGTARTCVLAWLLHEDGIELNGITLQSSVLDYTASDAVSLVPTFAADAWFHDKLGVSPRPGELAAYMDKVMAFAAGPYAQALGDPTNADPRTVATLSQYLGVPEATLDAWRLNVGWVDPQNNDSAFLTTLLKDKGLALGSYDGRTTGVETGIAALVDPDGGSNDPTMAAVGGIYTAMWNDYLSTDLKYVSLSNFVDLNDQAFHFWDFSHKDPTGAVQVPDQAGNPTLKVAGDLAATMDAFPFMRVLSANGYYDAVTPFFSTKRTLDAMVTTNPATAGNLMIRNYPSGHMVYLDQASRTALKADLAVMYDAATAPVAARRRIAQALPNATKIAPYVIRRPRPGPGLHSNVAADPSWTVKDLCAAYSWPTNLVGGGVIGLVELGGGWVQSDIDAYFTQANLPKPTIVDVPVGASNDPGKSIGKQQDPDVEVTLDILVAAASYSVATGKSASIRVYWADNSDGAIALAITAAAADGCDVCSISWGSDEANWQASSARAGVDLVSQLDGAAQAAARNGMLVLAAAGDNNSSDLGNSPTNVDLPAASPNVIACGGTSKPRNGTEKVWNNDPGNPSGQGTGGGFSSIFKPMPPWQLNAPHGQGRMIPDVSANADFETGYRIVVHGDADAVVGGTSAVAPLYAGLFAAFGRKLGFVGPMLWANQTAFTDITEGDNGFYRASPGPDPCTGLGVPIGSRLADRFGAPTEPVAVVEAPAVGRADTFVMHAGRVKHSTSRKRA